MAQKVIRTGNSLAITIPAWFAKDLGIKVGDQVKVKLEQNKNRIVYNFVGTKQLPLLEQK